MAKIAVIDDYFATIRLLTNILESKGHAVFSYCDTFRIEEKLANYQPDIVLLDINMPDRSGFEVLSSLKNNEEVKDTPVILISVNNEPNNLKRGLKQGAVDYIIKPFSMGRVISAVSLHLPKT